MQCIYIICIGKLSPDPIWHQRTNVPRWEMQLHPNLALLGDLELTRDSSTIAKSQALPLAPASLHLLTLCLSFFLSLCFYLNQYISNLFPKSFYPTVILKLLITSSQGLPKTLLVALWKNLRPIWTSTSGLPQISYWHQATLHSRTPPNHYYTKWPYSLGMLRQEAALQH